MLVVVAVAVAIIMFLRARRARTEAAPEPVRIPRDPFDPSDSTLGDPRTLKAGDMVDLLGQRLFVRGSLRLREGGYRWSEHFLDGMDDMADMTGAAGTRRWLSVEEDPDLEVVIWTELKRTDLRPDAEVLTHDGVEYRRDESGTATFASEGTTGLGSSGRVEYADFEGPGGRYLSFERFDGGEWEAGLGERLPAGSLTVYPGSDGSGG